MPQESLKLKKKRTIEILKILKMEYPDSKCSLIFESSFQLLVANILSFKSSWVIKVLYFK